MRKKTSLYVFGVLFALTASACGTKVTPEGSAAGNNPDKELVSDFVPPENGGEKGEPSPEETVSHEPLHVSMEIEDRVYYMNETSIPFQIINQSDKQISSALIPVLEKWNGMEWESMKCTTGFCGTQDKVDTEERGEALLEWYPDLTSGNYRILVSLTTPDGDIMVSDRFLLLEEEGESVISMEVSVASSEEGSKKINYTLTNLSEKEALFGLDFTLERQEGTEWAAVPMREGVGWNSIGLILPAGSFREESIDMDFYYEDFEEGRYRLTKAIYMDEENINVSSEFEIE